MESPTQETSGAAPRELDLFGEEALEEIFESIESLRAQIDQLQIHCEKLSTEKVKVDQMLVDKEKECHVMKEQLQEDINNLRKLNLQLLSSQKTSHKGMTAFFLYFSSCWSHSFFLDLIVIFLENI